MVLIPEMYEESGCFDPNSMQQEDHGFSQTHLGNNSKNNNNNDHHHQLSYHHQDPSATIAAGTAGTATTTAMEMELQQHCYNNTNNHQNEDHVLLLCDQDNQTNWYDMNSYHNNNHHDHEQQQQTTLPDPLYPQPPNLLTMFSSYPSLENSSISFANNGSQKSSNFLSSLNLMGDHHHHHHHLTGMDGSSSASTLVYDPLLPLNLPPQPPLLRELFHSLPNGYNLGSSMNGSSFFTGVDERETTNGGGLYQEINGDGRGFGNGVFEFTGDINNLVKGKDGKGTKHFTTERQRRVHLNDKFSALRSLVPNPTKNDRASIVGDGIDYIRELKRTVNDLKLLVEKKKCNREKMKRQKNNGEGGVEISQIKNEDDIDQPNNGSALRSSWLHRKSKNTEVDVRIIHDEVTIKLVQQKRINCLLFVSKVLDELHLNLHHVAGGLIGDYYSFLFNSKICEGSTVYAHAIANKLIEIVDKQYASIPPTNNY